MHVYAILGERVSVWDACLCNARFMCESMG